MPASGNSTAELYYSFTDGSPFPGPAYYRIKLVDRDGLYKYSPEILVKTSKNFSVELLSTNPFRDHIDLEVSLIRQEEIIVELFDNSGKLLIRKNLAGSTGNNRLQIQVPAQFPAAVYYLNTIVSGEQQLQKIVKSSY